MVLPQDETLENTGCDGKEAQSDPADGMTRGAN